MGQAGGGAGGGGSSVTTYGRYAIGGGGGGGIPSSAGGPGGGDSAQTGACLSFDCPAPGQSMSPGFGGGQSEGGQRGYYECGPDGDCYASAGTKVRAIVYHLQFHPLDIHPLDMHPLNIYSHILLVHQHSHSLHYHEHLPMSFFLCHSFVLSHPFFSFSLFRALLPLYSTTHHYPRGPEALPVSTLRGAPLPEAGVGGAATTAAEGAAIGVEEGGARQEQAT